ncbi:MAG: polysaccharide deacetylase [Nitrospira sp. ST-bin5]|nr:MAG: polysaccharide deacetylase [Nitrospira sp. ST-bin5]
MSLAAERPIHCLSFDVEEHFQVSAFWSDERRQQWGQYESRVERNTRLLADLLATHGMKATFFILGWVAERHPDLVKSLAAQGHEVASHGYGHELVTTQSPERFRQDVRMAKKILEDLIGSPVVGYRAPSFSITSETEWALSILVEEGYQYDSSVYDRFHRTEKETRPGEMFQFCTSAGAIWEVPPSTYKALGFQIPVAGGGYFRLFPYAVSRALLQRLESQGSTLVMYLHPWEIDPQQPRMNGSWLSQFRHYLNLDKTQVRLKQLLADFKFGTIRDIAVFQKEMGRATCPAESPVAFPS